MHGRRRRGRTSINDGGAEETTRLDTLDVIRFHHVHRKYLVIGTQGLRDVPPPTECTLTVCTTEARATEESELEEDQRLPELSTGRRANSHCAPVHVAMFIVASDTRVSRVSVRRMYAEEDKH